MDLKLKYMELQKSIKNGHFNILVIPIICVLMFSCIGIRIGTEIDLGNGYYYVQDSPQCICHGDGDIILPQNWENDDIVVRVQYNDSIIIGTCSSGYYATDSTIYVINKNTGSISILDEPNLIHYSGRYRDIKNHRRYARK